MPQTATTPQDLDSVIPFKASERGDDRNPFESSRSPGPASSALQNELEAQLLRAKGHLDDADRKNRQLMDEVFALKRQLAQDNTETMLAHKEEIYKLEREKEKEIRELEKQIAKLETDARFAELKNQQGDRDGWSRIFDFVEQNGSEFFTQVLAGLKDMGGQHPQQYTPEQLQAAFAQAAEFQEQNPELSVAEPEAGQPAEEEPGTHSGQQANQENEEPGKQPGIQANPKPSPQEMSQIKEALKKQLIDAALTALVDKNTNIEQYAQQVRSQMALYRQQGINLDAQAWTEMAKVLAERAIEEQITADRVAKVVQPAMDGIKQYGMVFRLIDPKTATDQLFKQFNIQASPPVRKLVTKVLAHIQNNLK